MIHTLYRYKNKKRYSTIYKRYVELPELLDYLKEGLSFQVIDHATRNNITEQEIVAALYHAYKDGYIKKAQVVKYLEAA